MQRIYHRNFHSLLGKPVELWSTNLLILSNIVNINQEALQYLAIDYNLGWSSAIFLTSALFRIGSEPVSYLLDKVTWQPPKFLQEPLAKLHRSLLLNNLDSDIKKLVHSK